MKKLIGMVSAVLLILFVNGSAFAVEQPFEETIEQGMETVSDGELITDEDAPAVETEIASELSDVEIPAGGEAPLAVWSARDNEASTESTLPSHIDSVKVDLSVDEDGQTFMPINE